MKTLYAITVFVAGILVGRGVSPSAREVVRVETAAVSCPLEQTRARTIVPPTPRAPAASDMLEDTIDIAIEATHRLPAGAAFTAQRDLLVELAVQNPRFAMETVAHLPETSARDRLKHDVLKAWCGNDPAGVLTWADESGELGDMRGIDVRHRVIRTIALAAGQGDAAAAEQWLASLTGDEHHTALQSMIYSLADTDPERALRVAGGDHHYERIAVHGLAEVDPARAIDLASALGDTKDFIEATLIYWNSLDPDAARAWAMKQPNSAQLEWQLRPTAGELGASAAALMQEMSIARFGLGLD